MNPRVEFDLSILKSNISELKDKTNKINFLFPVKCCKNRKVLNIINKFEFGFDISNTNEFNTIKRYLKNQFVSVSGPLSFELENIDYKNIHIVANNLSSYSNGKGLRINLNSNSCFDKSRFGIDYKLLSQELKNDISYIHLHNSDHKDKFKCNEIYNELKKIVKEFPNLKIINLGGHLEDLSFKDGIKYLNNVRNIIPENIEMYVELGDFLFKNAGTLYCKVIDVRDDKDIQYVTLNFSKMANQRWAYPSLNISDKYKKTIFYGCSCCETDIYLECISKKHYLNEQLIFKNISPYSYEWNTSFNGVDKLYYVFK